MFSFGDGYRSFRELYRIFFARFLENDLICVDGDTRGTLIGVVSLLVAPGVFLPLLEYFQLSGYPIGYMPWRARDMAAIPDKAMLVALSMTVMGVLTVFEWDALLPDRRDIAVLRPFPVGTGVIFAAKFCALLAFWLIFTLAVAGIPGILFPIAIVRDSPFAVLFWYMRSHAIALVAGSGFIFLSMIAIQGVLMTLLGARRFRAYAVYAQFMLVSAILTLFFVSVGVASGLKTGEPPSALVGSLPTFWFLGLEQVLLGWRTPLFNSLSARTGPALLVAVAAGALSYLISYRKSVTSAFELQHSRVSAPGWLSRAIFGTLARTLLRNHGERASFHFIWATVTRSRTHRLVVAAWAGGGTALVVQGITAAIASGQNRWWEQVTGPLLPAPIILPLLFVTGLRFAFAIPAELHANWIMQLGASAPSEYLAGARKAAALVGMAPFAVLIPVLLCCWGWQAGGLHLLMSLITAWLLIYTQMAGLDKLPFTCAYVPGKANVKSAWLVYVLAYLAYVSALSWVSLKIIESPVLIVGFILVAAAAQIALVRYRKKSGSLNSPLLFDECPAPAVQTLGL